MQEIQNTNSKYLYKMLQTSGAEFGIRKASYKHQLRAGKITEEYYNNKITIMDEIYFLLKELYSAASHDGNLKVF